MGFTANLTPFKLPAGPSWTPLVYSVIKISGPTWPMFLQGIVASRTKMSRFTRPYTTPQAWQMSLLSGVPFLSSQTTWSLTQPLGVTQPSLSGLLNPRGHPALPLGLWTVWSHSLGCRCGSS